MKKAFVLSIISILAIAAQGQSVNSQEYLILYKLDQSHGEYVLCRNYESPEKKRISETIIADTFSIELDHGLCDVIMSNACVLETKIVNPPPSLETNNVVQNKMIFKVYGMSFPKGTKLIFNNSIIELSKAKLDEPIEGSLIYEGDAALRQLKKMGRNLPRISTIKRSKSPFYMQFLSINILRSEVPMLWPNN